VHVSMHPLLSALLLTSMIGCGSGAPGLADPPHGVRAITGGEQAPVGAYPQVGVLLVTASWGGQSIGSMFCTGTLIAPDTVLTAAHCIELQLSIIGAVGGDFSDSYFSFARDVTSFSQTLTPPPGSVRIRRIDPHPGYMSLAGLQPGLGDNFDVGLAFLDSTVEVMEPAALARPADAARIQVGAEVEIVGYGQTSATDPDSTGVKYQARSFINRVGANEMQIGEVPPGDPSKCHGDSGGPTFLNFGSADQPALRVVGVTSHAYDETDCLAGAVDTLVIPYLDWIDQTMNRACNDATRVLCEDVQPEYGQFAEAEEGGCDCRAQGDEARWTWYAFALLYLQRRARVTELTPPRPGA